MKKTNLNIVTIVLLSILIISSGCGIVSLVQYKTDKIKHAYKDVILYNEHNDIYTHAIRQRVYK